MRPADHVIRVIPAVIGRERRPERPVHLFSTESAHFLACLARNAGKVCTRRMILEHVWEPGYVRELYYLKVYAYRIRRKLGDESGDLLQSDPAVGYRLALPGG